MVIPDNAQGSIGCGSTYQNLVLELEQILNGVGTAEDFDACIVKVTEAVSLDGLDTARAQSLQVGLEVIVRQGCGLCMHEDIYSQTH